MTKAMTALTTVMLAIGLTGAPRAQEPHDRIAFDYCYWWEIGYPELRCNVYVSDEGGATLNAGSGFDPALSPDGTQMALNEFESGWLVVVNLETGARTTVSTTGGQAAWSVDGRIAFRMFTSSGAPELFVMNADGSGVTQVTHGIGYRGGASWAIDSRIAFACDGAGGSDLCSIRHDGTQFTRLTNSQSLDEQPAFSPDGTRIAFVRDGTLAILNSDGTVTSLGLYGGAPVWSPEGSRIAFHVEPSGCSPDGQYCHGSTYVTTIGVPGATPFLGGMSPSWVRTSSAGFPPPVASFTAQCDGLWCRFDAGATFAIGVASYVWTFGDGTTDYWTIVGHQYAPGTYTVTLTVTDGTGATASTSRQVSVVNNPPVPQIQFSCDSLSCSFAGSAFDESTPSGFAWNFGDGTQASGASVTHVFPASGSYSVILTVTDTYGATGSAVATVTVTQRFAHIGDLNGSRVTHKKSWDAFVEVVVHDSTHGLVGSTSVNGVWSNGTAGTCNTGSVGACGIWLTGIPTSTPRVTFTVSSVTSDRATYNPAANHDVGGDTNGTSITITRR